ncbi:MAG: HD domain-containing protein, partial [Treponema sp.]|nr:HD domain-containing protein [Treponema sp.]
QENLNNTIRNMAIMVEGRDNSTGGHIRRSSDCVKVFIEKLKENSEYSALLTDHFCNSVINAAPMHDLGKITVKDSILTKNGKFTDEEYEQMKKHAAAGSEIVARILESEEDVEFKKIAINVAHFHHEKWNGQGYPEKISGEEIPLEARIMALADVFDALVSKRCYKESFSYDKAFEIIQDSLGSHFDPDLGKEFIQCRPQLEALYNSY